MQIMNIDLNLRRNIMLRIMVFLLAICLFPIEHGQANGFDSGKDLKRLRIHYKWLNKKIYKIVQKESMKYNLTVDLVCAVIQAESRGKVKARSHKGALGLMQIIPKHHYKGHRNAVFKPELNIQLGCKHLRWCLDYAKSDYEEALRIYNYGHARPRWKYNNWKYVYNIMGNMNATRNIYYIDNF